MDIETIIHVILILNLLWCSYYSIYFVNKGYLSPKIHLASIVCLLSGFTTILILRNSELQYQTKIIILFIISFIFIVSFSRQLYLFYQHRYAGNTEKILHNFAFKYNVTNFKVTGNFKFKELLSKANAIFSDKNSTNSEKYEAYRVIKRMVKVSQILERHKNENKKK